MTPTSTARRNLAHRIDDFLHRPTLPTSWQAAQVLAAIESLDEERFADGETIMMQAEKSAIYEPPALIPGRAPDRVDTAPLMAALAKVLAP